MDTAPKSINAYDRTDPDQWDAYTKYRPKYPSSLFQRIYTFHITNGGSFDDATAHDAGCGPGVTAAVLSLQFKHVICSDYSAQAVASARANLLGHSLTETPSNASLAFRVAPAEDMSWIPPASVDMVTMSECLHWTDTAKTVSEANRILKAGGTFAAWYYTQPRLPDNPTAEIVFKEIQSHWCKLRKAFSEESARTLWVEQCGYDCVAFPEEEWERGAHRVKFNTNGDQDTWVRDWDLAHMRHANQIGSADIVELVEGATDWQHVADLDWFRGWFESLFPKLDDDYLKSMLEKMKDALKPSGGSTRAVWPVSLLLASKKG